MRYEYHRHVYIRYTGLYAVVHVHIHAGELFKLDSGGVFMMYTRYHLLILRHMYIMGCIGGRHTSKDNATRLLPKSERGQLEKAYDDLVKRNLILVKPTSYGVQCSLNPQSLRDIRQLIDVESDVKDTPPLEESQDKSYQPRELFHTEGEKTVRGINAKYAYHSGINNKNSHVCYVIVENQIRRKLYLGSFHDTTSMLAIAVRRIDEKFGNTTVFNKKQFYSLGRDIEGNRQEPKALIDMLVHFGYLVLIGGGYYQRTEKRLPRGETLDNFQPPGDDAVSQDDSMPPDNAPTRETKDPEKPLG